MIEHKHIKKHQSSPTRRTITNSIWVISQSILLNIVSVFAVGYIARKLGVENYGVFIFAQNFIAMFLPTVNFGVRAITVRRIAEEKDKAGILIGKITTLRVGLAIIATIAAVVIVNTMEYPALNRVVVYITAVTIIARAISTSFQDVFQAFEKMKYIAYTQFWSGAILTILSVVVILMGYRLIGVTWVYTIGGIISAVLAIYYLYRHFVIPQFKIDLKFWKEILVQGGPFFFPGLVGMLGNRLGVIFLSKMAGNLSVGSFGAAATLIDRLTVIPDGVGTAIFPTLAALNKESREQAVNLFRKFYLYLLLLGLPLAVGTTILAAPVIHLIYGYEYESAILVLQILIWSLCLRFLTSIQGWTLGAIHKEKVAAMVPFISTPCYIIANIILIPLYREVGAAWASFISTGISFIQYSIYVRQHFTKTSISPRTLLSIIASNLLMAAVVYAVKDYPLWFPVSAAVVIYLSSIMCFRVVTKEDISKFISLLLKRKINPEIKVI